MANITRFDPFNEITRLEPFLDVVQAKYANGVLEVTRPKNQMVTIS